VKFVALLFAVLAAAVQAADPQPLESLVAPLLQAQTYCETGKFGFSVGSDTSLPQHHYRVCAHRDGRFKYVESPGQASQIATWSDGRTLHRYVEYSRDYQQRDLAARDADHFYDKPGEKVPALHSRLFRQATRSGAGLDLLGSLREYKANIATSDARETIYERLDNAGRGGERIRVAPGGTLVRYESVHAGVVRGYIEISARQVGQPLGEADLAYDVPLYARYSLRNNQPVFFGGLALLFALAGTAFWARRFGRAEHPQDVVSLRRRLWRVFGWSVAAVAALLGFLTVITWGGSGHPPAIAYVMVLAVLAGIGFGLVACFLLASYAGQALAGRRRQGAGPN
jgi:hypothetical protein